MDWTQVIGETDESAVAPSTGFAAATGGVPPEIAAAMKPPATEAELPQRVSMWTALANKFMTDPNLQRAIGLAGAMMAQPIQPGQNVAGSLGNAFVVGTNAYQQGQMADYTRAREMRAEGREDTRLGMEGARVGYEGRRVTEQEKTGAVGRRQTEEQITTERLMRDPRVKAANLDVELKEFNLKTARSEEDLNKLERDYKMRVATAKRGVTDQRIRQAIDDEFELNKLKLDQARADIRAKNAGAASSSADAANKRAALPGIEAETLTKQTAALSTADMSPEEFREFQSRTGRYAGTSGSSRTIQDMGHWERVYDRLKAEGSKEVQNISRTEWARRETQRARNQDDTVTLARLAAVLPPDDPLLAELRSSISNQARPGGAVGRPPPAAAVNMLKANPSAQNRAFFDQKYGQGAAERALGAGKK